MFKNVLSCSIWLEVFNWKDFRFLVKIANDKMKLTRKSIDGFYWFWRVSFCVINIVVMNKPLSISYQEFLVGTFKRLEEDAFFELEMVVD